MTLGIGQGEALDKRNRKQEEEQDEKQNTENNTPEHYWIIYRRARNVDTPKRESASAEARLRLFVRRSERRCGEALSSEESVVGTNQRSLIEKEMRTIEGKRRPGQQ